MYVTCKIYISGEPLRDISSNIILLI